MDLSTKVSMTIRLTLPKVIASGGVVARRGATGSPLAIAPAREYARGETPWSSRRRGIRSIVDPLNATVTGERPGPTVCDSSSEPRKEV